MKISNIIWNSYPEYAPIKEWADNVAMSYYLCKFENSLGFVFEVCMYDWEEKEFIFDIPYCGQQACIKTLVAFAQFNGENI